VIAGGPDAEETIKGTMALLAATRATDHVAERASGTPGDPLPSGGRPIAEAKSLHEARDRILGTILLPARTKATFGKDIEEMLRQRLTFG